MSDYLKPKMTKAFNDGYRLGVRHGQEYNSERTIVTTERPSSVDSADDIVKREKIAALFNDIARWEDVESCFQDDGDEVPLWLFVRRVYDFGFNRGYELGHGKTTKKIKRS